MLYKVQRDDGAQRPTELLEIMVKITVEGKESFIFHDKILSSDGIYLLNFHYSCKTLSFRCKNISCICETENIISLCHFC